MIITNTPAIVPCDPLKRRKIQPDQCVFFDIETTGLSWKSSHLYLLGAVYREEGQWIHRQWFCQRPGEEKEVLLQFSELLNSHQWLIHYNGNTFDVPYLMHKFTFYNIRQSWEHLSQLDLYQELLPYKKLLGLKHMRQKDLEILSGINRDDPFSGGELISHYQEYLKSGDKELYEILSLHNREDVEGMLQLLPLLLIPELFQGNLTDTMDILLADPETVVLHIPLTESFPVSLYKENQWYDLRVNTSECLLRIPVFQGTLRYFFPNYKDYYYLPLEDEAIHKSVGAYVDKEHREKAKACNCYKKVFGKFLPEFEPVFQPEFHREYKDPIGWFSLDKIFPTDGTESENPALLQAYANHLLKHASHCN